MRDLQIEGLEGFKSFVIKMLIQMARDFGSPSVVISDESTAVVKDALPAAKRRKKSVA